MLRACLGISIEILSYQRKFISKLVKTWHTLLLLTFDLHVDICFLNQISSLCYLFSRHALDIIFDLHRDERCKIHTRKRSASRKKHDRSIRDDRTSSARNLPINSSWRWRGHLHVSSTADLSYRISETNCYPVKFCCSGLLVGIRE